MAICERGPSLAQTLILRVETSRPFVARLFGYDIFLSFALGPPPRGTQSYASDLARRMRERDFTVFFSEQEAPPGEQLDRTLRAALLHSKILVVVVNQATLRDPKWVRVEVEEFRRRRPDRPVIAINVDGALQDPEVAPAAQEWLDYQGRIWLDESGDAVVTGIAGEQVVARLATAPRRARSNVLWRWLVRGAAAVLLMLTSAAILFAWLAERNAREADAQRRQAEIRLADSLTTAASIADAHEDGLRAREIVESARPIFEKLQRDAFELDLITLRTYAYAPPPLYTVSTISPLGFLPDGVHAFTEKDDELIRVEIKSGTPRGRFLSMPAHIEGIWRATHTSVIGVGQPQGRLALIDLPSGRLLRTLELGAEPRAMDVHAARRWAATLGKQGDVRVWDLSTGKLARHIRSDGRPVAVAFTARAPRLVVDHGDGRLSLWDVPTGRRVREVSGQFSATSDMATSPDGRVVVTGGQQVRLWDIESGVLLRELRDPPAPVLRVGFSRNGRLAMASGGFGAGRTRMWWTENGQLAREFDGLSSTLGEEEAGPVGCGIFHGTQPVSLSCYSAQALYFDLALGRSPVVTLALAADPLLLVARTADGVAHLVDATGGIDLGPWPAEAIQGISLAESGPVAVYGTRSGQLVARDLLRDTEIARVDAHPGGVVSVSLSEKGDRAVSVGRDGLAAVWEAPGLRALRTARLDGEPKEVRLLPGGREAVLDGKFGQQILNIEDGSLTSLSSAGQDSLGWTFSATGKFACTNRKPRPGSGPDAPPKTVEALARVFDVSVWDMAERRLLGTFGGTSAFVSSCAVSPSGKWLVTGDTAGVLRFYEIATGKVLPDFPTDQAVTALRYSADGRKLVIGTYPGHVFIMHMDLADLQRRHAAAANACVETLARNPEDVASLKCLGEWYAHRGVWRWAGELLERARAKGAEVDPYLLARGLVALGRTPEAVGIFKSVEPRTGAAALLVHAYARASADDAGAGASLKPSD
jgi:WD40 repeat protein